VSSSALRVGLTGGIACGKSQVLRRLASAGLPTIDLDLVAHEVMAPGGSAYEDVVAAFGPDILKADEAIDRKALGGLVFRDEEARRRLNALVHPRVWNEEARRVAQWSQAGAVAVVTDAALLVESGHHLRFDRLAVVHCRPEEQIRRLRARDGIDDEAARARLRAQMPIEEKRRFAHFEVSTSGSMEETLARADALAADVRRLAAQARRAFTLDRSAAIGCLAHGPVQGPRGLTPPAVLQEIGRSGGIDMERLSLLLRPRAEEPWYRVARPAETGARPDALAGVLALWQMARGFEDEDALLAASASVARLTHREPEAIGNACVLGLAMLAVAADGTAAGSLVDRLAAWRAKAERWAGGRFADELTPLLRVAEQHPVDVAAARSSAPAFGADPGLAGALVGLRAGAAGTAVSPEVEAAVDALLRISGRPATG